MKNSKLKVTLRNDGRYVGKYRDNDGRYRYVYSTDKNKCIQRLREALELRDRYLSGIKLYQYLDDWRDNFKKPNVKESTLSAIDTIIRVHVKKGLPNKLLAEINGLEIQRFLIGIERSRTRKSVYDLLNEAFKKAYALRLIEFNPMLAVEIPAHRQKKGSALSETELKEFLRKIVGHRLEYLFMFLLFTGCRRGEALLMRWEYVDFESEIVFIPGTKTVTSVRTIPLFSDLKKLLLSIPCAREGLIFNFRADYPTHAFKELCPNHKLHDLRHTFATRCLELGIPMKVVQEWLGHSKLDTTADTYSHVTKALNFEQAKRLTW